MRAIAMRPELHAFEVAYEGTPTWDTGRPQGSLVRMVAAGLVEGTVLDVGCGTGTNALFVASAGHDVVGIDGAHAAISKALAQAAAFGAAGAGSIRFVIADALELDAPGLIGQPAMAGVPDRAFDTALDIGLFHCLQPAERPEYAARLASVVRPGGVLLLVAWSDRNPLGYGPERISRRAIRETFRGTWKVETIVGEVLDSRLPYGTVHAWRAVIRRRAAERRRELGHRKDSGHRA